MKIILALGLLAVSAGPCFAQTADVFVKGDSYQCWLDVRQAVTQHGGGGIATEDEKRRILEVESFSFLGRNNVVFAIQVIADKNKKGEEGCRIYVAAQGNGDPGTVGQSSNAMNGSNNFRVAGQISAWVETMKKTREKKAKNKP